MDKVNGKTGERGRGGGGIKTDGSTRRNNARRLIDGEKIKVNGIDERGGNGNGDRD